MASVCPGGVLEDEAEDINQIARTAGRKAVAEVAAHEAEDDPISDDDLEGVPLAGNWCDPTGHFE